MDKPFILVNSGLVDLMDEDELRWVLAHELGHAIAAMRSTARSWTGS